MFKKYKIELANTEYKELPNFKEYNTGESSDDIVDLKNQLKKEVVKMFEYSNTKTFDMTEIKENWFKISSNYDIFLSHSHADKAIALSLKAWFKDEFNLNVFIDSEVWGYANDLLLEIDNKFAKNANDNTYNYTIRNDTTAHVHLMLSTSLHQMMDKCECVFFLSTNNSLSDRSQSDEKTYSPWIFDELISSSILRKNKPNRSIAKSLSENIETRSLPFNYSVNKQLKEMQSLGFNDLKDWYQMRQENKKNNQFDLLYELLENKNAK